MTKDLREHKTDSEHFSVCKSEFESTQARTRRSGIRFEHAIPIVQSTFSIIVGAWICTVGRSSTYVGFKPRLF